MKSKSKAGRVTPIGVGAQEKRNISGNTDGVVAAASAYHLSVGVQGGYVDGGGVLRNRQPRMMPQSITRASTATSTTEFNEDVRTERSMAETAVGSSLERGSSLQSFDLDSQLRRVHGLFEREYGDVESDGNAASGEGEGDNDWDTYLQL